MEPPQGPGSGMGLTDAQKWTLGGIAAVVVLLALAVVLLAGGSDDDSARTTTTTRPAETTTTEAPTTTEGPTTTTTTFSPGVDPFDVAFPSPEGSRRFEAPVAAARAYATDVLGFSELVLGGPRQTGEDMAEVVVQDRDDGPDTVISLQRAEGTWFVLGSSTEDIVVTQPVPGTSLATTFETTGEAFAFEGNVEVLVLAQDDPTPLGQGTVTGSGAPPAGPFEEDITFAAPEAATPGILVYLVRSPEDGRVVQATSFRVRLTNLTT
jgi:hypothetical protein